MICEISFEFRLFLDFGTNRYKQTDLYELCTIHSTARKSSVDGEENGHYGSVGQRSVLLVKVTILSGVEFGKTLGTPIAMVFLAAVLAIDEELKEFESDFACRLPLVCRECAANLPLMCRCITGTSVQVKALSRLY